VLLNPKLQFAIFALLIFNAYLFYQRTKTVRNLNNDLIAEAPSEAYYGASNVDKPRERRAKSAAPQATTVAKTPAPEAAPPNTKPQSKPRVQKPQTFGVQFFSIETSELRNLLSQAKELAGTNGLQVYALSLSSPFAEWKSSLKGTTPLPGGHSQKIDSTLLINLLQERPIQQANTGVDAEPESDLNIEADPLEMGLSLEVLPVEVSKKQSQLEVSLFVAIPHEDGSSVESLRLNSTVSARARQAILFVNLLPRSPLPEGELEAWDGHPFQMLATEEFQEGQSEFLVVLFLE
jgi:hypothetical protein